MNKDVKSILEKAMTMTQQQRAFIAERLIDSLETTIDNDAEKEWQQEIQKRMSESDVGFISWDEAKKRLRSEN
jgi:hypothetical protein